MELTTPDGVRIWWEATGNGPPVVLVPGRGDSADLFPARAVDGLVACGFRVVRFDPRDTGLSGDGGDAYTLSTMADDALAVLEAADPGEAAHWVGISMAGLILVDLVRRHPDRVRSLSFVAAMSPDPDAGFGELFFADLPEDPVEAHLASSGRVSDGDRAWVTAWVAESEARAPARPEAAERHMAASMRLGWPTPEDLVRIHAPTLVVHGTEDRTLPLTHAEALVNGITGAELLVREGMGHLARPADWDVIVREIAAQAVTAARHVPPDES